MIICSEEISGNYPVITMGTFDGVHLGHQKLIKTVVERAKINNGTSIVITYFNHPKEFFNKEIPPYLLTEKRSKERIIKNLGIDYVAFLRFDYQMSFMSAEEFLKKVVYERFKAKEIIFGYDCHFGYQRKGDYRFLKANMDFYGYTPFLIDPVKIADTIVSSSLIRNLVSQGLIEKASQYLGRYYDLTGIVVKGNKIGRELGFPTVNIQPSDSHKLIPSKGVYLSKAYFLDTILYCLTNIGTSPTLINREKVVIECHLMDFSGDLYGHEIRVEFIKRIRDEIKFSDKKYLIKAINGDIEYAHKYIASLNE